MPAGFAGRCALALALTSAAASQAHAQDAAPAAPKLNIRIPDSNLVIRGSEVVLKNNLSVRITCRTRSLLTDGWDQPFAMAPGAQWSEMRRGVARVLCGPPVAQTVYELLPGRRYAVLRTSDGRVAVREVAAQSPR